ncbi:SusC/RagA family TonB-linked outer membrane protein [Flectobacillus roseus]|uniref:SusC/RagA family TonB-linked outer membrane protein n=1 Tax=Flectobacillus roseus TaxID=502259 RepID=UPI0024B6945D|nr:TonB-dependent receptor [Flectobacillus roseus]MDI9871023.1 TonB-dependent receptor [Flectobacillus roseus]
MFQQNYGEELKNSRSEARFSFGKKLWLLMMFSWVSVAAFAQNKVTGTVKDAKDGSPLPGVTIQVKGQTKGTQTTGDGKYQINVANNTVLVFSFIGKATKEVTVGSQTVIDVSLEDDIKTLGEVVVIGYGSQKKKDLTGSVAAINSEDFNKGNIASPDQLVVGKVAGVQITSNGGAPGAGSTIRIRGGASLNANNDPLIVIDGVPLDNSGISGAPSALSLINPNDIESMNILKDASATAIYGSRASNGVILITTKKGSKNGGLKVNFSSQASLAQSTGFTKVLTADQFRTMINEKGTAAQIAVLGQANTNWQEQIYRNALSSDNNLSVSGALKNVPFRVSVGYTNQDGILKTSNMGRTSASIGISPTLLNNHLKIDVNLKGSNVDNTFANTGAIGAAIAFDPTQPVYSGNNNYGGYWEWLNSDGKPNTIAPRNPVGLLNQTSDKSTVQRSIGNIQLDYKFHFLPELRANVNAGYDVSKSDGTRFVPATAAANFSTAGEKTVYTQNKTNKLFDFYLNYAKELKEIKSRIDVMAGYEYQDFMTESTNIRTNAEGSTTYTNSPYQTQNTLVSFFGRMNYTFDDAYLLTFTVRRDGSSRFNPDNRWGTFPSAAFAWKLNEMSFLKNSNTISELKLRVGYGITGQQDIGQNYAYLPRYTASLDNAQYQLGNTFYTTLRAEGYDANIKWEQTATSNAGIDFAFKKARLSGSIDYYYKNTTNLLNVIPVAVGTNLTNQLLTNVGSMENQGVELALNYNPIHTDKFDWNVAFNATYNVNKITKLTNNNDPSYQGVLVGGIAGGVGSTIQIHSVGYPAYSFYVLQQAYDANGKPIEGVYVDRNGDGIINVDDQYRYKNPAPKVFLGFNSQMTYDNWSFGFVLRGNIGNYVYNNVKSSNGAYINFQGSNGYIANLSPSVFDSQFAKNQFFSDYYMENASFVRMENITLGYTFKKFLGNKVNMRLNATAQNVFTVTKYTGLNPEVSGGIDNNVYPVPRTYSLGLNLGF